MNKPKVINETADLQKKVYQQDRVVIEEYAPMYNTDAKGNTNFTAELTRVVPLTGQDPVVLDIELKNRDGRSMGTITLEDERHLDGMINMLKWYQQERRHASERRQKGGAR